MVWLLMDVGGIEVVTVVVEFLWRDHWQVLRHAINIKKHYLANQQVLQTSWKHICQLCSVK